MIRPCLAQPQGVQRPQEPRAAGTQGSPPPRGGSTVTNPSRVLLKPWQGR